MTSSDLLATSKTQTRSLLRGHLTKAWHKTIEKYYLKGLINSEAGLQTFFYIELVEQFRESKVTRVVFIEPNITADGDGTPRFPDLVICNFKSMIGVVELKFTPRARPDVDKDLETLNYAARNAHRLEVRNDRFLGPELKQRTYPLAHDAVLCWAGVYSGSHRPLSLTDEHDAQNHFLQLDALTSSQKNPVVLPALPKPASEIEVDADC